MKRVVLIRPGETDWNRAGRWQGWVASPLNALGRKQSEALGRFVRHIGLSALYTSDLRRALETAEALRQALDFEPRPDARLRERAVGLWQGLTVDEMRDWYPVEFNALLADRENFRIPGGESRAEVRQRMRAAFADIRAADDGETVGILSHTASMKLLLEILLPKANSDAYGIGNTSVTTLRLTDGGWELIAMDDLTHLEGLESNAVSEPEERR